MDGIAVGGMASSDSDSEDNPSEDIQTLDDAFKQLSVDAQSFYLSTEVPEMQGVPESPLHFYRDWVSQNRPVIFRGAVRHWKAFTDWQNNQYFRDRMGEKEVTVSMTPNGYADAIDADLNLFVMPHEQKMRVNELLDALENPQEGKVLYYQMQNSNLTDSQEWADLLQDVEELSWATQAFGADLDAINFWMGDHRAVTSTHKDPYENMYCVVRGHKDITLFPPHDFPWLKYEKCKPAKYVFDEKQDKFSVNEVCDQPEVPWIAVDPLRPDLDRFPEYRNATPLKLRLCAGDVLYLPSLWFHHISQSQGCVAVNFWYDMQFDGKYAHNLFIQNLVKLRNKSAVGESFS